MSDSTAQVLARRLPFEGTNLVRQGRAEDAVDGRTPGAWIEAASCADVAAAVAAAVDERWAFLVLGGGTRLASGNPVRRLDACLSTRRLDRIVDWRPEDMTVTAQSGVTHAALADVLARDGQRLALDPCSPERATLGGTLATNLTGGLAYGFGQPRDLVLGMTVVDGKARTLKVGGKVVKNVAGYDLVRLFCGSYGTLGAIVDATLRTHPLPERAETLAYRFTCWDAADRAVSALRACPLPLAALDFDSRDEEAIALAARVEGTAREIDAQVRELDRLCTGGEKCSYGERTSPVHPGEQDSLVVRVGAAPADALRLARELHIACGAALRVAGRLGDGALRACANGDDIAGAAELARRIRSVARGFGAAAFVERLHPLAKPEIDAWGEPPATIGLMREIKRRFDPHDVFAPGRFVGGI